ncbi:MAG: hypothetical protein WC934_02110 [Acidithiobacillus sp.]|jgi:16S rRNA G966 N2-methylase RsmD|uniref:hypothetical protein n=1 Tax=Acidithiobacillus sp. TaxID=1872118 RepID=UPI00355E2A76
MDKINRKNMDLYYIDPPFAIKYTKMKNMTQTQLLQKMIHEKYDHFKEIYNLEEDYCNARQFINAIDNTNLSDDIKKEIIDDFNAFENCDIELALLLKKYNVT